MKLIKINTDHYVVVDDSEIKEGNWYLIGRTIYHCLKNIPEDLRNENKIFKIIHSTQPMPHGVVREGQITGVTAISLQEVKELIGEVDVEKKIISPYPMATQNDVDWCNGYQRGYNQALEDNKEKKYTEEDVINLFKEFGIENRNVPEDESSWIELQSEHIEEWIHNKLIQSLQPKTEWEVEIVDDKLKLK